MKFRYRAFITLLAILLTALLLALASLPAAGDDRCVGSDDYDLCILQQAHHGNIHQTATPLPRISADSYRPEDWRGSR